MLRLERVFERLAQAVSIPHSPCVHCYQVKWTALHLSTVFAKRLEEKFLPNHRSHFPSRNFWLEPPRMSSGNFSCQGTDQFMPFALFTTLLGRVRLSQGNRWLNGTLILSFLLIIYHKNC
jgi:hypothetical protein